jgi:aspartyl-tRNA synthetase
MPDTLTLDFLGDLRRTHTCGQLRASDTEAHVVLMGWVHRRRDLGQVIFVHLRIVFEESVNAEVHDRAEQLRSEYVVAIEGTVSLRSPDTINPTIPTGQVEVVAERVWILNESRTPPFPMEETVDVSEDVRLNCGRNWPTRRGSFWIPLASSRLRRRS